MGLLLKVLTFAAGGFLIWSLWQAARPRRYFTIRLVDGEPRAVEGTVTPALLRLVREVATFNHVKAGRISGVARGDGIGLDFSKSIPQAARQQLRNGWGAMGWKYRPNVRRQC